MMKVSRGSKGFTLIELLIVVAIIGILAAIAIPAYTGYTAKARVSEVIHSMGAIKNAALAYYTEAGGFPGGAGTVADANFPTLFNISVPTRYANFTLAQGGAANPGQIVATFSGGTTISGIAATDTLTLTPDLVTGVWAWTGTGGAANYTPKN